MSWKDLRHLARLIPMQLRYMKWKGDGTHHHTKLACSEVKDVQVLVPVGIYSSWGMAIYETGRHYGTTSMEYGMPLM